MGTYEALVAVGEGIMQAHDIALLMERYRDKEYRAPEFCGLDRPGDPHYGYDWFDYYTLIPDSDRVPMAFIDLAGNWQSRFRPYDIDPHDGEQGTYLPRGEWEEQVQEFRDSCTHHGLTRVRCHW
jgi:hypothetical protein